MVRCCYKVETFRVVLRIPKGRAVRSRKAAARVLSSILGQCDQDREHVVVVAVDSDMHVIGYKVLSSGTARDVSVSPGDVLHCAIALRASGLIVAHTHPDGRAEASAADRTMFMRIRRGGELLGIKIHDQMIYPVAL